MFPEQFTSYKDRIAAGMEKLDASMPDWYRHIDANMLNIGSPTDCVCGQLAKFIEVGELKSWRRTLEFIGVDSTVAGDFGFVGTGWYDSYSELTREWRAAIKERLAFDAEVAGLATEARASESADITTGHRVAALA